MQLIPNEQVKRLIDKLSVPRIWNISNLKRLEAMHASFPTNVEALGHKGVCVRHYQIGIANVTTLVGVGNLDRLDSCARASVEAKAMQLAWSFTLGGFLWEAATICTPKELITHVELAHSGQLFSRGLWETAASVVESAM